MTAHYASAVFNMTYYKAGTNRVANVNGIFGTITDIDIKHNNTAYLFDGNEGFALTKAGTIIYDKSNKYGLGGKRFLQEEPSENGIHVLHPYKDTYGVNCNNICIGQAASFIYDNTSTCSIKYVGSQCSIGYTFASPYTYRIRQPSKSVSSQLVYEEEAFEYQISSYIANNYFATRIKFVPE